MIVAYKLVSTQFVRRSDRVKDYARPGLYRSAPGVIGREVGIERKKSARQSAAAQGALRVSRHSKRRDIA